MASFKNFYRTIFHTFGYPLTERTALSSEVLAATERRLGVRVPAALRDYFLVAGRERRFNTSCHRLLLPHKWTIHKQRIIFMEAHQGVGWWGVNIRKPNSDDPSVSYGIDYDPIIWRLEHRKCSVFLAVMLHDQAVGDGFRFCGQADVPKKPNYRFEKHGWTSYGKVHSMHAYSRPNQVVCLEPTGSLTEWSVFTGGKTQRDLEAIEAELGVAIESSAPSGRFIEVE